jgi:hypothetical protein
MICWGWFSSDDIKSRSGDLPLCQRLVECVLIDQSATRRVDQQWPSFHQGELGRRDHVACGRHQRRVKRDHVALTQHLFEGRVERPHSSHALIGREQHAHAEGPPDIGNRSTENPVADDAQGRVREIVDGIVKVTELTGPLPIPCCNGLAIRRCCGEVQG